MSAVSAETIRIESENRWDAVDLARRLAGRHTYLVQLGDRRWHVCVRVDGDVDVLVADVQRIAGEWARDRKLLSSMRFGGRTVVLP